MNKKGGTPGILTDNVNAFRLFKRNTTQSHNKYENAVFDGIVDPCVDSLRGKRINPKWFIAHCNNALKFGADSQINSAHVDTPLKEIKKLRGDNRDIIILSGGHGNEIGNNWVKVTDMINPSTIPRIIRAPWHYDPDFWVEDVERFMGRLGDEFQPLRPRITIVDIAEMNVFRFRDIIRSNSHVILGFCFGRNDRAFRYYLNLSPVVSKVNPPRV
ncbi:unnamed protein product [Parnassius apollo]|uniref:(apollo) hypothetical protein n=1 Tax=Parnassius apollo TaxID=110799 RepID=A0A8S3YHI7_PARAO|nr:unnamed protein product [Parnassius apollo]